MQNHSCADADATCCAGCVNVLSQTTLIDAPLLELLEPGGAKPLPGEMVAKAVAGELIAAAFAVGMAAGIAAVSFKYTYDAAGATAAKVVRSFDGSNQKN